MRLLQCHGTGSFSFLLHRDGRYFLRYCSIWSTGHPAGNSPYMASGFSHRSPLWPDSFHQLASGFQAMTSKPPIWQAPFQYVWLSGFRHPDPRTPFPVRITGYSNRNQFLPDGVLSGDFLDSPGSASCQYRLIYARQPQRMIPFSLL